MIHLYEVHCTVQTFIIALYLSDQPSLLVYARVFAKGF